MGSFFLIKQAREPTLAENYIGRFQCSTPWRQKWVPGHNFFVQKLKTLHFMVCAYTSNQMGPCPSIYKCQLIGHKLTYISAPGSASNQADECLRLLSNQWDRSIHKCQKWTIQSREDQTLQGQPRKASLLQTSQLDTLPMWKERRLLQLPTCLPIGLSRISAKQQWWHSTW